MPATATRLLTATEAQIRSGRSMVRFRQWVAAGRLRFTFDDFGRRRFDADDVDRLIAEVDRYKLEDLVDEQAAPAPAGEPEAPTESEPSELQTLVASFLNSAAHTPPSTTFEDHQP